MNINNNIYGSYYNALLTGVNSPYGKSAANKASSYGLDVKSLFEKYNPSSGIDMKGAYSLYGVKTGAKELEGIANALSRPMTFTKKGAVSSDPEAVKVKGSTSYRTNTADIQVEVEQIAVGQKNEGAGLKSADRLASGTHKFEIAANGQVHSFSVETKPGETQLDLQNKMAEAINAKDMGVKATISKDGKKGTSTLTLEAKGTGDQASGKFSIRDVSGSAVSKTGVGQIAQQAQDAKYSVDGVEKTSKSNEVSLKNGISAELKKATSDPVTVSMKADGSHAAQTIEELVDSFNTLLEKAETTDSARLQRDLSGVSKTYSKSLSRLGIQVDSKGYMSIDSDKLQAAAKDGSLEKSFTEFRNTSYGFTQRLSRVASNAASNPAAYTRSATFNPFFGTGLFFNMMI